MTDANIAVSRYNCTTNTNITCNIPDVNVETFISINVRDLTDLLNVPNWFWLKAQLSISAVTFISFSEVSNLAV